GCCARRARVPARAFLSDQAMTDVEVSVTVNGRAFRRRIQPRLLLSDFIRQEIGLTGTHVGCENGVCGACTVLLDGLATRACCMLAVQADGRRIETVESLGRWARRAVGEGVMSCPREAMGRAAEVVAPSSSIRTDGDCPVAQVNDL